MLITATERSTRRPEKTLWQKTLGTIAGVGAAVPVAYPHDALGRDKASGIPLRDHYKQHGLLMLPDHATWPSGGYSMLSALRVAIMMKHFAKPVQFGSQAKRRGEPHKIADGVDEYWFEDKMTMDYFLTQYPCPVIAIGELRFQIIFPDGFRTDYLVKAMKEGRVLDPIRVDPRGDDGRYSVIDGAHRSRPR